MDGSVSSDPGHTTWPRISDYWPDRPAGGHLVTPGLLRDEEARQAEARDEKARRAQADLAPVGPPPVGPPPVGPPQVGPPQVGPPQVGPPQVGPPPAGPAPARPGAAPEDKSSPEFGAPVPEETPSWDRDTEGYDALDEDDDVPAPPAATIIGADPADSRLWKPVVALVAAFVFLAGSAVVLADLVTSRDEPAAAPPPEQAGATADAPPVAGSPNPPVSIAPAPPTSASPPPSAPANPGAATFELVSNTTAINVSVTRLDSGLFRLSTPDDSGVRPRAELTDGTLRVIVDRTGRKGSGRVDVVLDDRTTWSVRMTGGVRRASFDLSRAASVPRVDLAGGAREIDLVLPPLRRTVPIRMTGGVREWTIRTAGEVPVRAQLRDGAGLVVLNGDRERGVRKGSTLTTRAQDGEAGGRLEVDAVAGVGSLKVSPA